MMIPPLADASFFAPLSNFFHRLLERLVDNRMEIAYLSAGILISVVLGVLLSFLVLLILRHALRSRTRDFNRGLARSLRLPIILAVSFSGTAICFSMLHLSVSEESWLLKTYLFLLTTVVAWAILRVVNLFSHLLLETSQTSGRTFSLLFVNLMRPIICIAVLCAAFFFIFQNVFHFNIGALLAGAGILAMAIAFAAQSTIANLFGTVSLVLDRPFAIGDRIVVGGKDGFVEAIGLRSTKVRSFEGTLWFIPNKEMTEATIENVSLRPMIRHVFEIDLAYSSTPDQVRRGVELLHEILDGNPLFDMKEKPPRIFFASIGNAAFRLQAYCWFQTQDFFDFTAEKDKINFMILTRFQEEGLAFALPVRRLMPLSNEPRTGNGLRGV